MKEIEIDRSLCLTEEEAMGLLDIVMMSPGDLNQEQRAAVMKLSEFCRQFLRESVEPPTLKLSIVNHQIASCAA